MLKAALAVGAIIALLFWGSTDAASDEMIVRVAFAAIIVLLFPLVYVWEFIGSPATMERELIDTNTQHVDALKGTIRTLSTQAVDANAVRLLASSLSLLIERGVELSTRRITIDELPNWAEAVRLWGLNCMALLRTGISHQDAVTFRTVFYDPRRNIGYRVNNDHNDLLNELIARIDLLREISARYKQYWIPMTPQWRAVVETHLLKFKGD